MITLLSDLVSDYQGPLLKYQINCSVVTEFLVNLNT